MSDWSERFGIAAEFHGPRRRRGSLSTVGDRNQLVRAGAGGAHNVVKHAGACNVAVLLQAHADQMVLIIEDDGRGFDAAQVSRNAGNHGLGLTSMSERAGLCGGTFEIDAAPGRGTTIFVRLPVTAERAL